MNFARFASFAALAAALCPLAVSEPAAAQSGSKGREHEITVTISRVKALDAMDVFSRGDFFARITIDGAVQAVPPIKQQADISPNWTITKKVPAGTRAIKLEILDKDVTKDEPVDINKVAGKRHQDFSVNTWNCRVTGFSGSPRCGQNIVRSGDERKKAEVTFSVSVKK